MGLVWVAVCIIAAVALFSKGSGLAWLAVLAALASFWSFGVMTNYRGDPESVPWIWFIINFLSLIAGIVLLLVALFM